LFSQTEDNTNFKRFFKETQAVIVQMELL